MQYGAGTITVGSRPDGDARMVEDCIGGIGIQLADEFAELKELSKSHPDEFRSLYVAQASGVLGHKSRAGNLAVAKIVATALALPAPAVSASASSGQSKVREQEHTSEVVISADKLASRFQSNPDGRIIDKGAAAGGHVFRVVAAGKPGEHYVVATLPGGAGRLTFSIEASADTSANVRLQVFRNHDATNNGVLGNFDLPRKIAEAWRLGVATDIEASISPLGDGWYKLSIAATLPSGSGQNMAIIQLANSQGKYAFDADGDAVIVRNMMIERSATASKLQVNAAGSNLQ